MGSHDRRIARLENALHIPAKVPEEACFVVNVVLGPERADEVRRGGFEVLTADERDALIAALEAEVERRDSTGEQIGVAS